MPSELSDDVVLAEVPVLFTEPKSVELAIGDVLVWLDPDELLEELPEELLELLELHTGSTEGVLGWFDC